MQTATLHAHLHASFFHRGGAGQRLAACLRKPWTFLRQPAPEPRHVSQLAQTAMRHPALRRWLLVIASESPRVRRALFIRAAQELQTQPGHAETTAALTQLADAPLLHAVTAALFRQSGLEPLLPARRTGRGARVRLSELAERLQAQDAQPLAA